MQAEELCTAEFEGFVGLPYEDSMLRMNFVIPSEERWDAGDRVVLCTIYDPAGEVSGKPPRQRALAERGSR